MTAMRMMRPATLAVVGLTVWMVAAWLLWRTKVPAALEVPSLRARHVFGADVVRAGVRFDRFFELEWLLATGASIPTLCVLARRGPRLIRSLGLGPMNAGIVAAVVVAVALWAVSLPFDLAAAWWSRRHGILRESWLTIVFSPLGGLYLATVAATLAAVVVLFLAARFARSWWAPAGLVALSLTITLQFALPFLNRLGTQPVRAARLVSQIREVEAREHVASPAIRIAPMKKTTSAANASAVGIGPSRSVFIWDTMLDGRFSAGAVRFVIAHEL